MTRIIAIRNNQSINQPTKHIISFQRKKGKKARHPPKLTATTTKQQKETTKRTFKCEDIPLNGYELLVLEALQPFSPNRQRMNPT